MTAKKTVLAPPNQPWVTVYGNQKLIIVNKPKYENNYLQVGNDEWMQAARDLKPNTTLLYFYMASNKDKYNFALSQRAVENAIGISRSTYLKAVNELIEKGYLIEREVKNVHDDVEYKTFDFYTTPQTLSG